MSKDRDFASRTGGALVIGGSGAIGRAVCERLAERGADLTLTYASNDTAAEHTATAARAFGGEAVVRPADLTDANGLRVLAEEVADHHGGIHTVVMAASPLNNQQWVSALPGDRYREQLRADAGGLFDLVAATLPTLRETGGSIVAVTTVANRRFVLRDVLSTGPKAANEALVRAVAAEEGRYGIRANAVGVGILGEGMTDRLVDTGDIRPGDLDHALSRIPLRSLGRADDIAEAVVFLASDHARYITGQWIDVDGGYSL